MPAERDFSVSILVLMDLAFEYILMMYLNNTKIVSILVLMDLAFECLYY